MKYFLTLIFNLKNKPLIQARSVIAETVGRIASSADSTTDQCIIVTDPTATSDIPSVHLKLSHFVQQNLFIFFFALKKCIGVLISSIFTDIIIQLGGCMQGGFGEQPFAVSVTVRQAQLECMVQLYPYNRRVPLEHAAR